jgi:hypothetical protein
LVKQRLYKDTFHIVFIKDEMGTLIKHALSDYAKTFSEKSQDDAQQLIILPIFLREYLNGGQLLKTEHRELISDVVQNSNHKVFIESFSPNIIDPPERI